MRIRDMMTVAVIAVVPTFPRASSEEAWQEFRTQAGDACLAVADLPEGAEVSVEVNPFGSEHYGAAAVTVSRRSGAERMICIYDKHEKSAEMTAPFPALEAAP